VKTKMTLAETFMEKWHPILLEGATSAIHDDAEREAVWWQTATSDLHTGLCIGSGGCDADCAHPYFVHLYRFADGSAVALGDISNLHPMVFGTD
jgi:hypothetical protein